MTAAQHILLPLAPTSSPTFLRLLKGFPFPHYLSAEGFWDGSFTCMGHVLSHLFRNEGFAVSRDICHRRKLSIHILFLAMV